MRRTGFLAPTALVAVVFTLALAPGCGDEDHADSSDTDGAFLMEMTMHHETAIDMAELARDQAQHLQVRDLGEGIVATQSDEIEQMEAMHHEMFGESMHMADHGSLGMASHEMGMDMEPTDLDGARPFDRAFIDAMIPHHQGAIRLARVALAKGSDPEVQELAQEIIDAQSSEITEMNAWREEWYGAPSPAGGVPEKGKAMPSHDSMGH